MRKVRFIGLDVHADTIAVAVAEPRPLRLNDDQRRRLAMLGHRLPGHDDYFESRAVSGGGWGA